MTPGCPILDRLLWRARVGMLMKREAPPRFNASRTATHQSTSNPELIPSSPQRGDSRLLHQRRPHVTLPRFAVPISGHGLFLPRFLHWIRFTNFPQAVPYPCHWRSACPSNSKSNYVTAPSSSSTHLPASNLTPGSNVNPVSSACTTPAITPKKKSSAFANLTTASPDRIDSSHTIQTGIGR
jgi:hypothetical protein